MKELKFCNFCQLWTPICTAVLPHGVCPNPGLDPATWEWIAEWGALREEQHEPNNDGGHKKSMTIRMLCTPKRERKLLNVLNLKHTNSPVEVDGRIYVLKVMHLFGVHSIQTVTDPLKPPSSFSQCCSSWHSLQAAMHFHIARSRPGFRQTLCSKTLGLILGVICRAMEGI